MAAVFVDREDSLDVVGSVVRRLAEGSSSALIVEGDSGMGKSSLLAEVRRRWSGGACRVVLVSRVPGLGRGGEYGPFLDALDELSASPRGGKRRSLWPRATGQVDACTGRNGPMRYPARAILSTLALERAAREAPDG